MPGIVLPVCTTRLRSEANFAVADTPDVRTERATLANPVGVAGAGREDAMEALLLAPTGDRRHNRCLPSLRAGRQHSFTIALRFANPAR
jgi:hypothetical protein